MAAYFASSDLLPNVDSPSISVGERSEARVLLKITAGADHLVEFVRELPNPAKGLSAHLERAIFQDINAAAETEIKDESLLSLTRIYMERRAAGIRRA